jgi:hypothetical protein
MALERTLEYGREEKMVTKFTDFYFKKQSCEKFVNTNLWDTDYPWVSFRLQSDYLGWETLINTGRSSQYVINTNK